MAWHKDKDKAGRPIYASDSESIQYLQIIHCPDKDIAVRLEAATKEKFDAELKPALISAGFRVGTSYCDKAVDYYVKSDKNIPELLNVIDKIDPLPDNFRKEILDEISFVPKKIKKKKKKIKNESVKKKDEKIMENENIIKNTKPVSCENSFFYNKNIQLNTIQQNNAGLQPKNILMPRGFAITTPDKLTEINTIANNVASVMTLGFNENVRNFNSILREDNLNISSLIYYSIQLQNHTFNIFELAGEWVYAPRYLPCANIIFYLGTEQDIRRGFYLVTKNANNAQHFSMEYAKDGNTIQINPCASADEILQSSENYSRNDDHIKSLVRAVYAGCWESFANPIARMVTVQNDESLSYQHVSKLS